MKAELTMLAMRITATVLVAHMVFSRVRPTIGDGEVVWPILFILVLGTHGVVYEFLGARMEAREESKRFAYLMSHVSEEAQREVMNTLDELIERGRTRREGDGG